uniref:Uncharacterized protein n=1 Tax=Rhizophora mucronata TaxID=61149 RepID=A0A2P2MWV3_RHIMU
MHDLASSVAGAGSVCMSISNLREVSEKTQHLSVDCSTRIRRDGDNWQVPVSMLKAKRLRTFLAPQPKYSGVGDYLKIGEGQCHAIFCNLRRLRQLDLGAKTVPNSIGKLKQLRYFDLSSNREIKMLPRSISRLQNPFN